jgi:hypothetical protein
VTVEDRATFESERNVSIGTLERRTRPRVGAGAHGVLAERHVADPAWDVNRLDGASGGEPTEDPADGLDLGGVRRSDGRGPKGKRHARIVRDYLTMTAPRMFVWMLQK